MTTRSTGSGTPRSGRCPLAPVLVVFGLGTPVLSVSANAQEYCFNNREEHDLNVVAERLVAHDLNHDQHPDVVVAGHLGLAVLLNDGGGGFPSIDVLSTEWILDIAIGDFNKDGHPDVGAVNSGASGGLLTFQNHGDGTFDTPTEHDLPARAEVLVVGDVNGDLFDDVVAAGDGQYDCWVYTNDQIGGFQLQHTLTDRWVQDMALGDVDHDSDLDLVLGLRINYSGYVEVLLNDGHGQFEQVLWDHTGWLRSVAVGLVNDDDHVDVVAGTGLVNGHVHLYRGAGDGSFQPPVSYFIGRELTDIALGDIDGDSDTDVVGVHNGYYEHRGVSFIRNDGNGRFEKPPVHIQTNVFHDACVLSDVDRDDDLDIVVGENFYLDYREKLYFIWNDCDAPRLQIDSSCPEGGRIRVQWENATPGGRIALVMAKQSGFFTVPSGNPCAGTTLDLSKNGIRLAYTGPAGADGTGNLGTNAPPGICGQYIQLLDLASCKKSNLVTIE